MKEHFDYVVVGAGSAGCVIAGRLSEAGFTVCVLEAGPNDRNPYIQIPAGYIKNVFDPKITWGFKSEVVPGTAERRVELTQGRVVGGSSSINGMIYNRGQALDYDGWAAAGNSGWAYEEVLPYFKKAESRIGKGDDAFRGRAGPLTVWNLDLADPLCELFQRAAQELGHPVVEDYNGAQQEGVGPWQFTIDPRGRVWRRMSAARAYLRPALRSKHLRLCTNSPATQILFESRRAVGVRYRAGGDEAPEREVRADREVIICAGALNTPRLLQISGIGCAAHLQTLGVNVRHDSPGVGANLTDHFQFRLAAKVSGIRTLNERSRGLPLAWEIIKWAAGRPSILGFGPVLMRVFTRSSPELATPDVQLSFTPASFQIGLAGLLDHYPGMTCGGYQQRPQSRGYVQAVSRDIRIPPKIQPNYLSADGDQAAMVFVFRTARALLHSRAFAPHFAGEVFPGKHVQSESEILDFARSTGGSAYHHVGTARMGPKDDRMAVVDADCRVYGLTRLRVVDASIMPTITSGNTNAPTIMIAEKIADDIISHRL
ncbi:GMC family oxidoreductase [Caballeronia zhejiangensis]|uniref:GMC family oxidoreductase n=1 Tax=Caballeronia zhejiangensis TaxID=871203 RepID=UPI001EF627F0|nr:GMC family oxidoreductase N-terminal domain-containing protein [Caballeronia zhejiangensis]MCG7400331.1 GMC family oxidoreductase N-terminal domain-containing protein [Caballeronia zhejiangensis]